MYKALAVINLPPDNRKEPGSTITLKELKDAGQGEVQIKQLLKSKAMGAMDDPIHPDHVPPEPDPLDDDSKTHVIASEDGKAGDSN